MDKRKNGSYDFDAYAEPDITIRLLDKKERHIRITMALIRRVERAEQAEPLAADGTEFYSKLERTCRLLYEAIVPEDKEDLPSYEDFETLVTPGMLPYLMSAIHRGMVGNAEQLKNGAEPLIKQAVESTGSLSTPALASSSDSHRTNFGATRRPNISH